MSKDFRELLTEEHRSDWGRIYNEIDIAGVFGMSVQASDVHGSTPEAILDDPNEYEAFEVTLRQLNAPFLDTPIRGAWEVLEDKPEFASFERGMITGLKIAEFMPVAQVQAVFDALVQCAEERYGAKVPW